MHIVQKPTPGIPAEIEVDFLGRTEVKEFGDYGLSILARIRTGDGEIRNGRILSIDPEIKSRQPTSPFARFLSSPRSLARRAV